jgi:ribosomal protein L7/L12
VVTAFGAIAAVVAVVLIVTMVRRYTVSEPAKGEPPGDSTDADVARLAALGHKIEAIKLYRRLHATDLKTAKDAVDRMSER